MAQARRASGLMLFAIAALLLVACGGGGSAGGPGTLRPTAFSAGCGPVIRYPEEGSSHLSGAQKGSYKVHPPHSGNHAPRWAPTGIHSKEVTDAAQVHNLEHGAVVIQYVPGKIPAALLKDLESLAKRNAAWVLLAPRSADRFDDGAVLGFTSWGVRQVCTAPDATSIKDAESFYDTHAKKGPEKVAGQPVMETPPSS